LTPLSVAGIHRLDDVRVTTPSFPDRRWRKSVAKAMNMVD
jgi:hypothetical protein